MPYLDLLLSLAWVQWVECHYGYAQMEYANSDRSLYPFLFINNNNNNNNMPIKKGFYVY